jgi:cell shape-determining protein MreC
MRFSITRISKPNLFIYLMLLSVVLLLMPAPWKGWIRGIVQPLGWLQSMASSAARVVRAGVESAARRPPPPEDVARLAAEVQELRRQSAAQALEIQDMSRMLDDLSGMRDQLRSESARIIFGTVLGGSGSPRHETLTIWPGSQNGASSVKVGDWVAAGLPEELRSENATGRELLLRQWLIGRVSEVYPYRSTVRLTTDADFGAARVVAAKRMPDGRWKRSEREGLLYGLGNGKMQVRSSPVDFSGEGYTHALAVLPGQPPITICVGKIVGSRRLPEAALHFNVDVESMGDVRRLGDVYVLSLGQ